MASPKKNFIDNKQFAKIHNDYASTEVFTFASESALLELIASLPDSLDPVVAASAYQRVLGARQYLVKLATIGLPASPITPKPDTTNLNHNL